MEFEPLSNSTSTRKISIVRNKEGLWQTQSSERHLAIIVPMAFYMAIGFALYFTGSYSQFGFANYFKLTLFVAFLGLLLFLYHKFTFKTITFNTQSNQLIMDEDSMAELSSIKAIQLLTYQTFVSGNYRIRYEINLVQDNESRLYLFNNVNYQHTVKQAQKLSELLGVDIQDLT